VALDIVVVNYHTPEDLKLFLDSVDRFPPACPSTLTVIDVAAEAEVTTFDWAGGVGTVHGIIGNIGYARACNYGATRGSGDVIALFNADIEVTAGALDACHDALQAEASWGILGPRQIDNRRRLRHAGIFGTHAKPVHRGWQELDRGQYTDVRDAVTVSGSAYFVKRQVWNELTNCPQYRDIAPSALGAFLPTQHYYEETWCSYHAWAHDYRVIYFGPVTIFHQWHRASPVGGWAERQMPNSRDYFRSACDLHGIPRD
jgi:GT2 family glycosyltransferase